MHIICLPKVFGGHHLQVIRNAGSQLESINAEVFVKIISAL